MMTFYGKVPAMVIAGAIGAAWGSPAAAQVRTFDIAPQPARTGIPALSVQGDVQILASPDDLRDRRVNRVAGRMTAEAAIAQALAGSGLTSALVSEHTYAIKPQAAPRGAAIERQLDEEAADDAVVTGSKPATFKVDVAQIGAFRNQSLLDTPLTVAVVNRDLLDAQGAVGLEDAVRNAAGITQQGVSPLTSNSFAARGVIVNARTNFRLNGTLPVFSYLPPPLENKERVEILKGVSALYYGFTTPSAVVNMVTKRAGTHPVNAVLLTADAEGSAGGGFDVGRTFGRDGMFGARINGFAGHLEAPVDGLHGNRWFVSGAFDIRATDRMTVKLDAEYYERSMGEPGAIQLPAPVGAVKGVGGTVTLPPVPDPHNRYAPTGAEYRGAAGNLLARVDYAFSDAWALRTDIGYARTTRDRYIANLTNINLATGEGTMAVTHNVGEGYDNSNLRVELTGKFATGPFAHDLLVGFTKNRQAEDYRTGAPASFAQNLFRPRAVAVSSLVYGKPKVTNAAANYGTGLYALDIVRIGEQWMLIGGARSENVRIRSVSGEFRLKKVTPTVGVVFHPTPRTSLYGTYIEGLESAGTAPDGTANAGAVLPPLVSRQAEFGARAELGSALLSAAYFRIDRALAFADPVTNIYGNDGRARYQGVEASFQGTLVPAVSVAASAQYLDAIQQRTSVPAQNGKPVLNAPNLAASLFAEYRPPALRALGLNAGVYYTGRRSADFQDRARLPAYALLSLGANYRRTLAGGGAIVFRVNADNLLDKRYYATTGDGVMYVGVARTVRFSANLAF